MYYPQVLAKDQFEKTAGIYIHIPYCRQACVYCNFHFSTNLKNKKELIEAIIAELVLQRDYLGGARVDTIYFGGGTPSLLTSGEINTIFDAIFKIYPVTDLRECTLEANPDDLDHQYLKALRHTPVTRLSIGVQSFREQDLLYMKRAHHAQQADYAIKAAQDAGFDLLSIDLIYGTPGLTNAAWKHNLGMVKSLCIPHFSAYALTVEPKTALHHDILTKKAEPVDPEQAAGQFEILMEHAQLQGYDHYEISNFALPGKHAIHNTNYWLGLPYLGIGPSAHSFNGGSRRWNISNNALYTRQIMLGKPLYEEEIITPSIRLNEYIMTSLRTMWGCDLAKIALEWDSSTANSIEENSLLFLEKRWLHLEGRKLLLTNEGKLFADKIAAELFVDYDDKS